MGFSTSVADEVLVRCGRHCCLCGKYVGSKIELHHIKQVADGGDDSADNCIPLCFDCHAEVKAYNPRHPKGRKYTERELKGHRDKCYERYSLNYIKSEKYVSESEKKKKIFTASKSSSMICWGYPNQDLICPVFPGNIVLIAGYTGSKKSTYVHHIVNHNIQREHRVSYCCTKERPYDVGIEILAENSQINAEYIKRGIASEKDWDKLLNSPNVMKNKNLALIPYSEISEADNILSVVENSGAEIVVIDDFNGIVLNGLDSVEQFLYKLKNVASQSEVVVFVIYNISIPKPRCDMRPLLRDFPSDSYYRLFDIVHLLYKPDCFYKEIEDKGKLEVIITKGALKTPYTIELVAPDDITGVFAIEDRTGFKI